MLPSGLVKNDQGEKMPQLGRNISIELCLRVWHIWRI